MNEINKDDRVKELISSGYEIYKDHMIEAERELCETFLYEQGEYEEAVSNIIAIMNAKKIIIDDDVKNRFNEVFRLWQQEPPTYFGG